MMEQPSSSSNTMLLQSSSSRPGQGYALSIAISMPCVRMGLAGSVVVDKVLVYGLRYLFRRARGSLDRSLGYRH
jgi:hypothetical protein